MKFAWLAFILVLVSPVVAFNSTLSYGECITDPASNNTYCSPLNTAFNQTYLYQQCIADTNSKIVDLNNSCNSQLVSLGQTISNLTVEVKKVQGVNLSGAYASCIIDLNLTKFESIQQKVADQQSIADLTIQLQNKIPKQQLDDCNVGLSGAQKQLSVMTSSSYYYYAAAFLAGLFICYYWFIYRKRPSSSRDIRGGRMQRIGESMGSSSGVPPLAERMPPERHDERMFPKKSKRGR